MPFVGKWLAVTSVFVPRDVSETPSEAASAMDNRSTPVPTSIAVLMPDAVFMATTNQNATAQLNTRQEIHMFNVSKMIKKIDKIQNNFKKFDFLRNKNCLGI